jgi:DNA-binding transcriptional MerR regulator
MTLSALADAADVSARTVRYYIAQGLLPPPAGSGGGASYGDEHLRVLAAIRALKEQHLPLAEIRLRLAQEPAAQPAAPAARSSALDYIEGALRGPSAAPVPAGPTAINFLAGILAKGAQQPAHPLVAPSPPSAPSRSTWERHQLAPDVELHIRRPLSRELNRKVDRLLTHAATLFEDSK